MNKFLIALALLGAGTLSFSARAAEDAAAGAAVKPAKPVLKPSDLFTNTVIAKGKGVTITRVQLDEALVGVKSGAAARGQTIPPEQMNLLERQVLQRLIQVQVLDSKATEADKAGGKELVDKRLEEIKQRAGSEAALEQQLKSLGMTRSELIAKMTEEAVAETVLKRELKTTVTDADIKKLYDENPAMFEEPELVRAAHILLSTKDPGDPTPNPAMKKDLPDDQKKAKQKQMEALLKRARAGEDFAKLAKENTEDPGSKDTGGEYTFARGQMMPEFEGTAFSLNTNQVSDIVTTPYGYHIIKLYEKIPAHPATLEDEVAFVPAGYIIIKKYWHGPPEAVQTAAKLSQIIRQKLESDQQQKQIPDYMEKVLKDADVQILDESLKAPEIPKDVLVPRVSTNRPAMKP